MSDKLEALKAAALAIGHERWVQDGSSVNTEDYRIANGEMYCDHIGCFESVNGESPHAKYVAAASPAVVLSLLAALEEKGQRIAALQESMKEKEWRIEALGMDLHVHAGCHAQIMERLNLKNHQDYDYRAMWRKASEAMEAAALNDAASAISELLAVREAQSVPVGVIRHVIIGEGKTGCHATLFSPLPAGTELFTAPPAPAVPAGFKLVPVEPTEAMINAGREIDSSPLNMSPRHRVELIYRAMLTEAPTPTKAVNHGND
jgi:hypothetical protein